MIKFYDTSSLLLKATSLHEEPFVISSITLQELENIKSSGRKDLEVKHNARLVLNYLDNHDNYTIHIFTNSMLQPIEEMDLEVSNDMKILATAIDYDKFVQPDETIFVSNDIALKNIANLFFGSDMIQSICEEEIDPYCGYKDVILSDEQLNEFYTNQENTFDLKVNEYLIIRNQEGEVIDRFCWTGEEFDRLKFKSFRSRWFGEVRPMKDDVYQMLAADSFSRNNITMIKGPAGTGKSYLSLAYLLNQLEYHKIDKIIIFCNTVATKNSARLGFYPGTRDEKLLDSQIGNLLSSKIGDKTEVERLIAEGKLVLLPLSDIRGYDTSGMNAGIYISEAQNMDVSLMKLALQRIGEDSICIIDGDEKTQVDDISFAGNNNGMKRVSKIFRDTDVYGEIELRKIHRSKIAQIAERM
jgi:predicted ribonuclease YlaK